jgi:hypothetical protein
MRIEIEADIFDDIIDDLLSGRSFQPPEEVLRRKTAGEEAPKDIHTAAQHSTTGLS